MNQTSIDQPADGSVRRRSTFFRRGYPLRYTIAFVFTVLTLVSGSVLIVFNYIGNQRTTIQATHDLLERLSHQVAAQVSELILPVHSVINISSKTIHSVDLTFDTRLGLLEHFVEILRHNPRIASMTVADVDGDFFMVRSLENNPAAGEPFQVPPGTHFIAQGIDREMDELVAERIMFLDEKLFPISDRKLDATSYDHRQQPWFKASIYRHALSTTDYYFLFGTREIGLTVARRLKEGRGVVAADLTLRDMSLRLAQQRITPSTELILTNHKGIIVAHSDFSKIGRYFDTASETGPNLPKLKDFGNPLYTRIAETISFIQTNNLETHHMDSAEILGYLSKVPTKAGQELLLASLIPREELLAGAIHLRNRSILISLAVLAFTIFVVFWLAQRISTSLRLLTREAQQIREFKFGTPISVKTRILEVNDLADTMAAQKDLIDSIIHLIAGSIDAKSPYTSRHCQRVPIIVGMLAEAAQATHDEPFCEFSLGESEKYALHLASWLHDCGKLTKPEYVVDKATKLETIYNRIHEIRMRFEVLWRDAEIDYYQSLVDGSEPASELNRRLQERRVKLQRDFAFVAQCNIGGEFMSSQRIDRLQRIASRTWQRHFDDRLGVSEEELQRKQRFPQPVLPVRERLLADKPEHLVNRPDNGDPFGTNPYGFNMEVPKYLYNYGELTNLTIARGALTAEERFAINNHIIQTIKMLRTLPLPKELRQVPDWAGNHHEAYCGHGYPRRLVGRDLSIPERIMAVADVFEALTAADRPYKRARPLSETLKTMSDMCRQGHLCPDIFRLLMVSGVYRRYAEAHLDAAQLNAVDVDAILADIHPSVCATPERLASASKLKRL
jgi:HD-GYP domain-containing protein (c-di-GMP phosphodiesterase class II)